MNISFKKVCILMLLPIFLFGCATGSSIITGTVRPAIDPELVILYLEPPENFEIIGLVEAASDVEFSRQMAQDRTIQRLKVEAAKIGANVVLLSNVGSGISGISGYTIGDQFFTSSTTTISASGRAIYVFEE